MNIVVLAKVAGDEKTFKFDLSRSASVTIGRSWKNDIVLNDEFVDPEHAEILLSANGEMEVRDLGSCNGVAIGRRKVKGLHSFSAGSTLSAGDSSLQIIDEATAVSPARKRDWITRLTTRLSSAPGLMLVTLLMFAISAADIFYLRSYISKEDQTSEMLGVLIMLGGWTFLAGMFGKLFRQKMHLSGHWVFSCLLVIIMIIAMRLVEIVDFNLPTKELAMMAQGAVLTSALFALAIGTLSLATRLSVIKKTSLALSIAMLPVIFGAITSTTLTEQEKWGDRVSFENYHQPPLFQFSQAKQIDEHVTETDQLFRDVDYRVQLLANQGSAKRPAKVELVSDLSN